MESKFFNGVLVFFCPDGVFKRTVKAESAFEPLLSLLLFAVLSTAIGVKLLRISTVLNINLTFSQILLAALTVFFSFVIVTAALSCFFDWIYTAGIKINRKAVTSDFLSSFCCHAYVIPIWVFLLFVHIILPGLNNNVFFIVFAVCLIIRLLDIEARLIKIIYKLRLIQGYVIIFAKVLFVLLGAGIACLGRYIYMINK